jgi:hypothetical protein
LRFVCEKVGQATLRGSITRHCIVTRLPHPLLEPAQFITLNGSNQAPYLSGR